VGNALGCEGGVLESCFTLTSFTSSEATAENDWKETSVCLPLPEETRGAKDPFAIELELACENGCFLQMIFMVLRDLNKLLDMVSSISILNLYYIDFNNINQVGFHYDMSLMLLWYM
jgi:hypothetical protein